MFHICSFYFRNLKLGLSANVFYNKGKHENIIKVMCHNNANYGKYSLLIILLYFERIKKTLNIKPNSLTFAYRRGQTSGALLKSEKKKHEIPPMYLSKFQDFHLFIY